MYDFLSTVRQFQGDPNTFNFFFPCVIAELNKSNPEMRSCRNYNILRKSLLNFIRPSASKVYNANDTISITLIPIQGHKPKQSLKTH